MNLKTATKQSKREDQGSVSEHTSHFWVPRGMNRIPWGMNHVTRGNLPTGWPWKMSVGVFELKSVLTLLTSRLSSVLGYNIVVVIYDHRRVINICADQTISAALQAAYCNNSEGKVMHWPAGLLPFTSHHRHHRHHHHHHPDDTVWCWWKRESFLRGVNNKYLRGVNIYQGQISNKRGCWWLWWPWWPRWPWWPIGLVYQISDANYLIFRHFTIRHIL